MENQAPADQLLNQADLRYREGDYEGAAERYTQSLKLYPTFKGWCSLAQCQFKTNKCNEAISSIQQAIYMLDTLVNEDHRTKQHMQLLELQARVYERINDYSSAITLLDQIISANLNEDLVSRLTARRERLAQDIKGSDEYKEFYRIMRNQIPKEVCLWHLISNDWIDAWRSYNLAESSTSPGPISNSNLISELDSEEYLTDPQPSKQYTNVKIKPEAIEGKDYTLVPKAAYSLLAEKYGHDNTEIKRWSVALTEDGSVTQVEVRLKEVNVVPVPSPVEAHQRVKKVFISRRETVKLLRDKLTRIYKQVYAHTNLNLDISRLWKIDFNTKLESIQAASKEVPAYIKGPVLLIDKEDLENSNIADEDIILIEFKRKDGRWTLTTEEREVCINCKKSTSLSFCSRCKAVKYCSKTCQKEHYQIHKDVCRQIGEQKSLGLQSRKGGTGLQNLGNTCFMNSALQCMSHTMDITEYFLKVDYLAHINTKSVLGTGGHLVSAYADLLRELWLGSSAVVSPWTFKRVISKFAPQFTGYMQHDSHELLCYLLDGLHEDLNQITKKPYIEAIEGAGRPDEEVSRLSWENHLKRNHSLIVELMHGQYKSTLVCPDCGKVSVTFDPFLSYSVSIPGTEKWKDVWDSMNSKRKVTLQDCLHFSSRPEKLDAQNAWYCGTCKTHVEATKTYQLYKLPQILMIQLKRFKNRYFHTEKISTLVDFPLENLDMSDFVLSSSDKKPMYDLYAISNHYGGLGGGHYTAYVKNPDFGWLEMDDSHVSRASPDRIVTNAAYVLFYKRRE
jgi:ubiquitin C-terminal hydrolase